MTLRNDFYIIFDYIFLIAKSVAEENQPDEDRKEEQKPIYDSTIALKQNNLFFYEIR